MKKILFISYFFPPSANSGAFRVLRIANEINKLNWEPVVLSVEEGYYGRAQRVDYDLLTSFKGRVYRSKGFYPFRSSKNNFVPRLLRRIWAEIAFPDDKVVWTINASLKALLLVRAENIGYVFISGPPFSSFLIGVILKKRFKELHVSLDYRDPWTGTSYYIRRKWKHVLCRLIEKYILARVDRIYTVTPKMTEFIREVSFKKYSEINKLSTLTYSFSPENFSINKGDFPRLDKFILTYAGSSFGVGDPGPLLKVALRLRKNRIDIFHDMLIIIIGNLLDNWENVIKKNRLNDKVLIYDYMPYKRALSYMQKSHILLLPYNMNDHMKICLPGKLFDYFLLKRPILFYGPKGQIWETINNTEAGFCRLPSDLGGIAGDICFIYDNYFKGKKSFEPNINEINKYRTDNVINKFVKELEDFGRK